MFDRLIRGGRFGTVAGLRQADLGLRDGRVAAWLASGKAATAAETSTRRGLSCSRG